MKPADMSTLLSELAIILFLARLAGWAFSKVGLPAVVGEILAGVLLGPSLLGASVSENLFPADTRTYLVLLANIGLVLFMFVVGLELDMSLIRGRGRVAGTVSALSIVVPFTLGLGLAAYLADDHNSGRDFWPFALFVGAAMSVTAFPVLARILTDRGLHRTETGGLALACAATDDVLAWTLLAVVIAIGGGAATAPDNQWLVALAVPFAVFALVVVRPQLNRLTTAYQAAGRLTPGILTYVLLGLLLFAATTEYLHVHFIFGAFLFGAIMPQEGAAALRHEILVRLEQISVLLLLPVFFLVSGLNVNIRGLSGDNVVQLALILATAIGGKFAGAYIGARLSGVPRWQANTLAVLMNTRGLTELVILNVGRDLGIIGDKLFTMLVIMAVVTTVMTGPLLTLVYPARRIARDIAAAERAALGGDAATFRAMVIAEPDADNLPRLDLAVALVERHRPAEVVVVSLEPQGTRRLDVGSGLSDELAAMTASMERLEVLVQRGVALGVPVRIVSHPSASVADDVAALAEALEPELIVVGSGDPAAAATVAAAECLVVTVSRDAPSPRQAASIAVVWDHTENADAAVVVACLAGSAAGATLHLGPDDDRSAKRLEAVTRRIGERGVVLASDTDDVPADSLRVGPDGASGLHVAVRSEVDPEPVDWAKVDLGVGAADVSA